MTDPLHDQLVTVRRQHILQAAARVFAEKGYHQATIRDIAREAGIADGTIYNYFDNKTALLIGIFDLMTAAAQDSALVDAARGDLRTFLRAFLSQPLLALQADNFELLRIILSEIMVNRELRALYYTRVLEPTIALAEAQLRQRVERGELPPFDAALLTRALSAMVLGLMVEHILGDPVLQTRWDELPDLLTDLIASGMEGGTR